MATRRTSSTSRKVVWDEENLKENEEIQKEYSAVRIQEPKTPYRPPLPSDSLEDEMKPLQLDEVASALGPERMTAFEYVMSNGGAAFDGAGSSQQQHQQQQQPEEEEQQQQPPPAAAPPASTSNASSEADGDKVMQDALGDKRNEPCTSFTSSGSEGSGDKRRKFEQMRKQHYNMRDALVKAKQLLDTEDEDDAGDPDHDREEDEEEEDDDTANCQNCNGMAVESAGGQPGATQQRSLQGARQQPQQGGASSSGQQVEANGGGS